MDKNITIKGLDSFDDFETAKIKEIVFPGYTKIQRDITGALVILAKKHQKDGGRAKYSFKGKINTPTTVIDVDSTNWELEKALHILINKIQASAQNKFRK